MYLADRIFLFEKFFVSVFKGYLRKYPLIFMLRLKMEIFQWHNRILLLHRKSEMIPSQLTLLII